MNSGNSSLVALWPPLCPGAKAELLLSGLLSEIGGESPCLRSNWNDPRRFLAANSPIRSVILALSRAASPAGAPGIDPSMLVFVLFLKLDNDDSAALLELSRKFLVHARGFPYSLRFQYTLCSKNTAYDLIVATL